MPTVNSQLSAPANLAVNVITLPVRVACWFFDRVVSLVKNTVKLLLMDLTISHNKTSLGFGLKLFGRKLSIYVGGTAVSGSGQPVKEYRKVGSFGSVNISGLGNFVLHQGTAKAIEITAQQPLHQYLETQVDKDQLVIRFQPDCDIITNEDITIDVWAPKFEVIKAVGVSTVKIQDKIKQDDLEIDVSGTSTFTGCVDVQSLKTDVFQAAKATITGQANKHQLQVQGSSTLHAKALTVNECEAQMQGATSATVSCYKSLEADVSGVATLKGYLNNVQRVKTTAKGAATVELKGTAVKHESTINGSATLRTQNLQTQISNVTNESFGMAKLG